MNWTGESNDSDCREGSISGDESVEEFYTVTLLVAAHMRLWHKRSFLLSHYKNIQNRSSLAHPFTFGLPIEHTMVVIFWSNMSRLKLYETWRCICISLLNISEWWIAQFHCINVRQGDMTVRYLQLCWVSDQACTLVKTSNFGRTLQVQPQARLSSYNTHWVQRRSGGSYRKKNIPESHCVVWKSIFESPPWDLCLNTPLTTLLV